MAALTSIPVKVCRTDAPTTLIMSSCGAPVHHCYGIAVTRLAKQARSADTHNPDQGKWGSAAFPGEGLLAVACGRKHLQAVTCVPAHGATIRQGRRSLVHKARAGQQRPSGNQSSPVLAIPLLLGLRETHTTAESAGKIVIENIVNGR